LCFVFVVNAAETKSTSIGILPFEGQSVGEEYSWLSAGISDTLIAKFTGTKGIRVLEREKLASLANVEFLILNDELKGKESISRRDAENTEVSFSKNEDLRTKLNLLNAQYLLIGSYTVLGEQIRINARIVHAAMAKINGESTLSVKGNISDIFALETELAEKFAKACNLEVAYNKLSYSDGKNTVSYRLFNQGKIKFENAKECESSEEETRLFENAIDLFTRAQQQNDGFYFAEAHTWEGKARIALANSTDDQSTKLKVQQAHVAKFEADAAEAAPAFYDLGVALQACGQYDKAIKAYDDYLRWMSEKDKEILWEYKLKGRPLYCVYSFNGTSGASDLSGTCGVSGECLFFVEPDGEGYILNCNRYNGESWRTLIIPDNGMPGHCAFCGVGITVNHLYVFCNNQVFTIDKERGGVLKKSKAISPPVEGLFNETSTVFVDEKSGEVVVGGVQSRGREVASREYKRFVWQVNVAEDDSIPVELYSEEWSPQGERNIFWQRGGTVYSSGRETLSCDIGESPRRVIYHGSSLNGWTERNRWRESQLPDSYIMDTSGHPSQGRFVVVKESKSQQVLLKKKLGYRERPVAATTSGLYSFDARAKKFILHNIKNGGSVSFSQQMQCQAT